MQLVHFCLLLIATSSVLGATEPQNPLFKTQSVVFRTRCKLLCSQVCGTVLGVCDRYGKCVCLNSVRLV